MTHFAAAVRRARQRYGWTLAQIAARLGVSLHTVRGWLKPGAVSRREPPAWATLALWTLIDGRPRGLRQGALVVTYAPAPGWEAP